MKPEKIKEQIEKGHELKEIARKSTEKLEYYLKAAEHFKKAADISQEIIDSLNDEPCKVLELDTFKYYYLFENFICQAHYQYEKRDQQRAIQYYEEGLSAIEEALHLINNKDSKCAKDEVLKHLDSFKDEWTYMEKSIQAQKLGAQGRKYWDNDNRLMI